MKSFARCICLLSSFSAVLWPQWTVAQQKIEQREQFENVKRMQAVFQKLGRQATFGSFYDEMKKTIPPKYKEYIISKVHRSGVSKSRKLPKIFVNDNVIEVSRAGTAPIKIEFVGSDGVYAKINGFPILSGEAESPQLVFQKLQEISQKINSQNRGFAGMVWDLFFPRAEAFMDSMMMMMMMMMMFGGGGGGSMMMMMPMMMMMGMGGGGGFGVFGTGSAR